MPLKEWLDKENDESFRLAVICWQQVLAEDIDSVRGDLLTLLGRV